jgi:hypothetical protein
MFARRFGQVGRKLADWIREVVDRAAGLVLAPVPVPVRESPRRR